MKNQILTLGLFKPLILLALLVTVTGCVRSGKPAASRSAGPSAPAVTSQSSKSPVIDLEKIKPNELGRVLILEYHEVSDTEGRWSRHYNNFKADLQRLYQVGYRPISLRDYVQNNVQIPAGTSPVIFTFDDATAGQFRYIEDASGTRPDPNSAVAILESFHSSHPDWKLAATFYVYYPNPFRQPTHIKQKLQHIVSLGMDIGNHTYSHVNLSKLSAEDAQKEMALSVQTARSHVPDAVVDSIALPYGIGPDDSSLLRSGEYGGQKYHNIAALLVGAEPAPSPASSSFNPYRLPRVQAIQSELDKWLGYFERHPEKLYISDGDPNIITIPKGLEDEIDTRRTAGKRVRTY